MDIASQIERMPQQVLTDQIINERLAKGFGDGIGVRMPSGANPAGQACWAGMDHVFGNQFEALGAQVQESKSEADATLKVLPKRLAEQVENLKVAVREVVESAKQQVAARTEEFENKAAVFEKWLNEQIVQLNGRTSQVLQGIQDATRQGAEAAEQHWQQRINQRMTEHERQATAMAGSIQNKLEVFQQATGEMAG